MNTENSKTNEPHKFILNLSQRFHFKQICSNKFKIRQVQTNMLVFKTDLFITCVKI